MGDDTVDNQRVTALPNAAPLPHHVTVVATTSMIHSTDLGIFKLALSVSALLFVSRLVFSSLYVLVLVVLD